MTFDPYATSCGAASVSAVPVSGVRFREAQGVTQGVGKRMILKLMATTISKQKVRFPRLETKETLLKSLAGDVADEFLGD